MTAPLRESRRRFESDPPQERDCGVAKRAAAAVRIALDTYLAPRRQPRVCRRPAAFGAREARPQTGESARAALLDSPLLRLVEGALHRWARVRGVGSGRVLRHGRQLPRTQLANRTVLVSEQGSLPIRTRDLPRRPCVRLSAPTQAF